MKIRCADCGGEFMDTQWGIFTHCYCLEGDWICESCFAEYVKDLPLGDIADLMKVEHVSYEKLNERMNDYEC